MCPGFPLIAAAMRASGGAIPSRHSAFKGQQLFRQVFVSLLEGLTPLEGAGFG